MIIIRIEMKLLFSTAKLVDTLINWNFVLHLLSSKDVDNVWKTWVLRTSYLWYLLFIEFWIVITINKKIDHNWLTKLGSFPVSSPDHFYFQTFRWSMLKTIAEVFCRCKATDVTFLYPMSIFRKLSILSVDTTKEVSIFHFFIKLLQHVCDILKIRITNNEKMTKILIFNWEIFPSPL